jgi:hypothetical protein
MPLSNLGVIRYSIYSPQGARFDQTNDYSYQPLPAEFSPNSRVVVYVGQERVWGNEPSGSARQAASLEPTAEFSVRVVGNPIADDQVRVEVTGADGQPLRLLVSDLSGRLVSERQIETAGSVERHGLDVSQSTAGVLLLQVSTPTQSRTVKVLKTR